MSRKPYEWDGQDIIEAHSLAKHELIHNYIVNYIKTLTSIPAMREIKLTLVDGFAGGGLYRGHNGQPVFGSPLRMLQAVREAQAWRQTAIPGPDLAWKIQFYFVEPNPRALHLLKTTVADEFGQTFAERHVHYIASTFQEACPGIVQAVRHSAKRLQARQGGRAIFFLDQYGYKDLPFPLLRSVLRSLPNAELVFNFGVDDLIDYVPREADSTALKNLGLDANSLIGEDRNHPRWRQLLQSTLAHQLIRQVGAKTFTPFFIRRDRAHRDYWLVHCANHARANDVMKQQHWSQANSLINFEHYGGPGLNMLGFNSKYEEPMLFAFKEIDEQRNRDAMMTELLSHGQLDQPVQVNQLYAKICNETPADQGRLQKALQYLSRERAIEVQGSNGEKRRPGTEPEPTDVVQRPQQGILLMAKPTPKSTA